MSENQADASQEPLENTLDLSELSKLNFGPSWTDESTRKKSLKEFSDRKSRSGQSGGSAKRDRRGASSRSHSRNFENDKRPPADQKNFSKAGHRTWNQSQRDRFESTINVSIYPQDEAFDALVKRLRSTARTYQLFEIANLILEKPERYIVAVQNKAKKHEKPDLLYYALPDYLPFETEDSAVSYVLGHHLELFFDIEAIELEPPKGNFQVVNRCTITGELLGPPNYHRYQEFLQRHYASKISTMSFDRFVSKVESVKEQESIDAWVESMKKGFRYILKDAGEGEPESFESLESVRSFLLQNRKDKIIGSGETVRFAGRSIEHLPKGAIRRSVEAYIESQLRFPLDTANNIRGRLRRQHFTVYKKGSESISYVCAVKRKFRDSKTVFTPSIQELIEIIEKNPDVPASKLPKLCLNIDTEKQQSAKLEMTESEVSKASLEESEETADTAETQTVETAETSSVDAAASTIQTTSQLELSEEDMNKLNQLMLDLRWLIFEGYVTEYGDGRLFAAPPMPNSKSRHPERADAVKAEKKPDSETTSEVLLTTQDSSESDKKPQP